MAQTGRSWFSKFFGRGASAGGQDPGSVRVEVADSAPRVDVPPPPAQTAVPPAPRPMDAKAGHTWKPGSLLLGQYEVERLLGRGGMGAVHLVRDRDAGRRFAVKVATLRSDGARANFLDELKAWTDLPEHPHLVPCRFFRTVGDRVAIFADYVDGGSLADWIRDGRLYAGGPSRALERILGVAIQFAWGLEAAHEIGLVHQDVKPANVMMTADGVARVSDFGLSQARAAVGAAAAAPQRTAVVPGAGCCTPAYCSPEQARGQPLSRKTDQWSWGVSVLEMFAGEVTWRTGAAAAESLEAYLAQGNGDGRRPAMPDGVARVLRRCFHHDPARRHENMGALAGELAKTFQTQTGHPDSRTKPVSARQAGPAFAHDRWVMGARWTNPLEWLEEGLTAGGRDPAEAATIVSPAVGSRRAQAIADLRAYDVARRIFEILVADGKTELESRLADLCIDEAFVHQYLDDSSGAFAAYDRAIVVYERLVNAEGRRELANRLAAAYMNKANAIARGGDPAGAAALYDRCIQIRERLVNAEGRRELADNLAMAYVNKAVAAAGTGDLAGAAGLYDRAIAVYERLVNAEGRRELADNLARAYMNKANAIARGGDPAGAAALYDRCIQIRERLVNAEGRRELADDLAMAYLNKANAAADAGDPAGAAALYDRCIQIRERLVNEEGRTTSRGDLAWVRGARANVLAKLGDVERARREAREAVVVLEAEVRRTSRADLRRALAWAKKDLEHLL